MSKPASKKETTINIRVVKNMRDYSKDPVLQRMGEEAKEFLKKHGLPESFKKRS